jgi:hypothetical protein
MTNASSTTHPAAPGAWLKPFIWTAWLGVATTLINTAIPVVIDFGIDAEAARLLRGVRDPVLLVHAVATLLPMLALALLAFRAAPFAATGAAVFTAFEKFVELVGESLILFPPEEVIHGVSVREVVAAVWDQLFFVLWFCNTVAGALAGWLMLGMLEGIPRWLAAFSAWMAAALTLLLLMGPEYLGWISPAIPDWLFSAVFVAYRCSIAMVLMARLERPRLRGWS